MANFKRKVHTKKLKEEMANGAQASAYAADPDDQARADRYNAKTEAGPDLDTVTAAQIYNAVDTAEDVVLGAIDRKTVDRIYSLGDSIETAAGTRARSDLLAVFGAGTTSRDNLLALVKPNISAADRLQTPDADAEDVANALALP